MAAVKPEVDSPGFEDDVSLSPVSPRVKPEFEDEDDDEFEESLDMEMGGAGSKVWLVRLPKFLMDKWKDAERIPDRELGKVRIRNQQGSEPTKFQLILKDTPDTSDIPHNYDISLIKQVVDNTYVFTEKDLPKYNRNPDAMGMLADDAALAESSDNATSSTGKFDSGREKKRFVPYVRTIPKKTALVGTACHECAVMPSLRDPNYSKVVNQRRQLDSEAARAKVTFLSDMPGVNTASFGQSLRGKGSMFMRAQKKDPAKAAEGKAIRIAKNELLDLLFKLFEDYDYWSMKGLRERTKQPESYLKEVLETMAILIKKGPYAMKYMLKPEFKQIKGLAPSLSAYMERASTSTSEPAPEQQPPADDDDDADVEMENVL